ncbi:MAG TPA: MmcQ/YjbR family DNA-binding protein [Flavobacterium sp.]
MDIEDIRNTCIEMRGVSEEIKWKHDLVFSIGGKMFCVAELKLVSNISFI